MFVRCANVVAVRVLLTSCFVCFCFDVIVTDDRFLYRIPHRAQAKDRKSVSVMSLTWTHGLDVNQVICPRELRSHCVDKKCTYQHLGAMKGGMGHALSIIDHIEANMSTAKMRLAEKAVVRARLDIYSGKTFDVTLSTLLTSLYPVASQAPFSVASASLRRRS